MYSSMLQGWRNHPCLQGQGQGPVANKELSGYISLAKVFEIILSCRITPLLEAAGIPQVTQTAYREGVSCTDSVFSGLEATAKFQADGDNTCTCFYDLASAFDTVEFSVLLENLFHAGVRGKCWRLLRDWYHNLTSQVRLGSHTSESFGIRQGSVLSPMLFNLVMDPLLTELREKISGYQHQWSFPWCLCSCR